MATLFAVPWRTSLSIFQLNRRYASNDQKRADRTDTGGLPYGGCAGEDAPQHDYDQQRRAPGGLSARGGPDPERASKPFLRPRAAGPRSGRKPHRMAMYRI